MRGMRVWSDKTTAGNFPLADKLKEILGTPASAGAPVPETSPSKVK